MNNPVVYDYKGNQISIVMFDIIKIICTFAMRHFYIIRFWDFLYPIVKYCLSHKQGFLRTYSPKAYMEVSQLWRNALLSSYLNK